MSDLDKYLQGALPTLGGWLPTELPRAAVLCPILTYQGRDQVLFVLRPEGTQVHAGQIAFPGGMHAPSESPLETARRESFEEVGAPGNSITPLGELKPRESTSKIHVHCIVARVAPFELQPDPREVARILHMPLDELRDDSRWQEKPPPITTPGLKRNIGPHFQFEDNLLWGLTARFIRDLVAHLPRGAE